MCKPFPALHSALATTRHYPRRRVTVPFKGRSPPLIGVGSAFFVPVGQSNNPWRDASRHRQPFELTLAGDSPFFERSIAAYRLVASRHRRTRALTRHAFISLCNFIVPARNHNDGPPCFEGQIPVMPIRVRTRSAQNASLTSSVGPNLSDQKQPYSGISAGYARRYLSRTRSTLRTLAPPSLPFLLFKKPVT